MQIIQRSEPFDAVIVGSGATGGWAAKLLTEAGLKVAVLEAGPPVTEADFTEHVQPWELKYRGDSPEIARNRPVQSLKYACRESNYQWFVDDVANPYSTYPGTTFQWTRCRILGGRSLTWARQSYRFSDLDLKAASHDGYGEDWPLAYSDLAPYYDKVERYVGVSGSAEGLPQLPDGQFMPPMPMSCGERFFKEKVEAKWKRTVTIGRVSIITRDHNGRSACHYCGPCEQGCITYSYYSSPFTTLKDAQATGRLTLITDAVAYEVTQDRATGLASGVAYVDRRTRQPRQVRARAVLLCASALESTRLLLNSGPGFANSSGVLGRYVMDHISSSTSGVLPVKEQHRWFGPPRRPNGLYIPRFRNVDRSHTGGMIRGYGYQCSNGSRFGSPGWIASLPGFGRKLKQAVHERDPWRFSLSSSCECLPRYDNFVELDPDLKDAWGIPALRMHVRWSDNELKLAQDANEQAAEMLEAAGAKDIRMSDARTIPGGKTHEVGTARMGSDPRTSVLNSFCQSHDIKNLFVTDGAAFVTVAWQNPTLTMMALTARACDYFLDAYKKGELA